MDFTFQAPEIADNFDAYVMRQLPWYIHATKIVRHLARAYVAPASAVFDIGASTGNIGRALDAVLKEREATFYAIEPNERIARNYDGPSTLIIQRAEETNFYDASLIVAFLTLQFLDYDARRHVIQNMKDGLRRGGALIVFDRFEPTSGHFGLIQSRLAMALKLESGETPEQIIEKELSLSGIQRPLSHKEISDAQQIFQFGDFSGIVYERF